MTEAEKHRARAASFEREIKALEAQFGTGVRPGWVSTDISIAMMARDRHLAAAERAEQEAAE